jgi:hypothetical protein
MGDRKPLIVSEDGRYYLCAACRAPIIRGDRCVCWRGWILIEVDADGNPTERTND